jgi:four helix bundle protein
MSILEDKSYKFAIRIVKLNKYLTVDFINKLYISLKEANESRYWLRLLNDCNYITDKMFKSMQNDIEELLRILTSSIKTTKESL